MQQWIDVNNSAELFSMNDRFSSTVLVSNSTNGNIFVDTVQRALGKMQVARTQEMDNNHIHIYMFEMVHEYSDS